MSYEEVLIAYRERFDENFPVMIIRDKNEAMKIIQECLKTGEPFIPDDEPDNDY